MAAIVTPIRTQSATVRSAAIDSQLVHPACCASGVQVVGSKKPTHQAKMPIPVMVASIASELLRNWGRFLALLFGYFCTDFIHVQSLNFADDVLKGRSWKCTCLVKQQDPVAENHECRD